MEIELGELVISRVEPSEIQKALRRLRGNDGLRVQFRTEMPTETPEEAEVAAAAHEKEGEDGRVLSLEKTIYSLDERDQHSNGAIFVLAHLADRISNGAKRDESVVGSCGVYGCTLCAASEVPLQPKGASGSGHTSDSKFDLPTLFHNLPSLQQTTKLRQEDDLRVQKNYHLGVEQDLVSPRTDEKVQGSVGKSASKLASRLVDLPPGLLQQIAARLDVVTLRAFLASCRYIRRIARDTTPFLKLKLYSHQKQAVEWMLQRENNGGRHSLPHPLVHEFRGRVSLSDEWIDLLYQVNIVTGEWCVGGRTALVDCRGGLFCDEPGLGKTISSIALVLRTLRLRSMAPPGSRMVDEDAYVTLEDMDRIESQRFVPLGVSHRASASHEVATSGEASPQTPKRRRIQRPDYYGGKSYDILPSPSKTTSTQDYHVYLSAATLVVAPYTLLDHWRHQLTEHVDPHAFLNIYSADTAKDILDAKELASYDIVLTSFTRLSHEYRKIRMGESQLLRVHWSRIILDEGHKLSSIPRTDLKIVSNSLRADRRWIMTGTPTPNTPSSDVRHLFPLLEFIREPCYGLSSKTWEQAILKPYESYKDIGAVRLQNLLRRVMTRSNKEDIACIPKLSVHRIDLELTDFHAEQYNETVEVVQRNLLLAEKFNGDKQHSLIRPNNSKACFEAIMNLRKACCVAGHVELEVNRTELLEALRMVLPVTGGEIASPEEGEEELLLGWSLRGTISIVGKKLLQGGNCDRCGYNSRCPILTPCGHVLCSECVEQRMTACVHCGDTYSLDEQGYPEELIELQPSYSQTHWKTAYGAADTTKLVYLLRRLREIFTHTEWIKGAHRRPQHKVIIFSHFLEHLDYIQKRTRPLLYELFPLGVSLTSTSPSSRSRDRLRPAPEALEYYAATHKAKKDATMEAFRTDPNRPVLLMDVRSALGHDLSFVKYMFIMEPIWDRARELQVISRAHRMGAQEPIVVEKLVVRNTVEVTVERTAAEANHLDGGSQHENQPRPPAHASSLVPVVNTLGTASTSFEPGATKMNRGAGAGCELGGSPPRVAKAVMDKDKKHKEARKRNTILLSIKQIRHRGKEKQAVAKMSTKRVRFVD